MTSVRFIILATLAWTLSGSAATALPDAALQPKPPTAQPVPQSATQPNPPQNLRPQPAPISVPQPFLEESALVPVKINGETVRLEMLFVKPQNATGRLPIVLISHGKPATQAEMATVHATNYRSVAHDFARRGWLAVAVVRRGYGLSEGKFEAAGTCKTGFNLMRQFRAESEDLASTLEVVTQRRDVDPNRIVALGVSNGGVASLALSAMAPRGLRAVINISGGLRSRECPFDDQLVSTFRSLGELGSAPSLWMYAENDSFFPPALAARLQAAYAQASPPVTFVKMPAVSDDGHKLFSSTEGRFLWWPEVDKFFRSLDLPTWPAGMIDQVMQQNQLDPKHRSSVERYVSAPGEKALVKGGTGATLHWWAGADNSEEATRRALAACVDRKAMPCTVIMRNWDGSQGAAAAVGGSPPARKTP